jgi:MFS family permease
LSKAKFFSLFQRVFPKIKIFFREKRRLMKLTINIVNFFEKRFAKNRPNMEKSPIDQLEIVPVRAFYGWLLMGGLFIMYVFTNGVILNTLPIFYPEFLGEFGWSPAQVTQPAQLLFLVVAIASPFIGALLDRYGARRLMIGGSLLIVGGFLLFTRMSSLRDMLLVYLFFSLGITAAGIIPSMYVVTHWFRRLRGIAVGVLLIGSSLGGAMFNQVAGVSIEAYQWRTALLIFAIIAAAMTLTPALFIVRDRPADKGQYPDGDQQPNAETAFSAAPTGAVTLGAALRSPTFYLLLLITGAMWFCIVGVIQHQTLYFADLPFAVSAKDVLSLFFISSILGKLTFGYLSDRFDKKRIMLLGAINLSLGATLLYLVSVGPPALLWLYAFVFGLGFSGAFTMIQLLVAEYYAGPSYGKILGLVTMIDTLAGVLGILALGQIRTRTGAYEPAFLALIAICVAATVCVLLLRDPRTDPAV